MSSAKLQRVSIEINGRATEVFVLKQKGFLWSHYNGRTRKIPLDEFATGPQRRRGGVGKEVSNKIIAPMPGKIIKVMVRPGDVIAAEQITVVMEAMKMEYSLKATQPCSVESVLCKEGGVVTQGQELIIFKESTITAGEKK